jgi:BASS family bile acid:Na+ symporter
MPTPSLRPKEGSGTVSADLAQSPGPVAFAPPLAHPARVSGFSRVLAPAAAALMLFALGLTLDPRDLRGLWRRPTPILVALLARWIAVPAVAVLLCLLTRASPITSLGLLVVSASPVGSPAAGFARLGRSDTSLALATTAVTGVASVITLPLVLGVGAWVLVLPWGAGTARGGLAVLRLGLIVVMPILAGGVLRWRRPALVRRAEPFINGLVTVVLILLVTAVLFDFRGRLVEALAESGWRALAANVLAVGAALGVSRLAGLEPGRAMTVALSAGLFHFGVAVFVVLHVVGEPAVLGPVIAYGVVMWASAVALVLAGRREAKLAARAGDGPPT